MTKSPGTCHTAALVIFPEGEPACICANEPTAQLAHTSHITKRFIIISFRELLQNLTSLDS
jgi:hypothetical protein